jgi:DNA-binding XRE family transcriptional regulator
LYNILNKKILTTLLTYRAINSTLVIVQQVKHILPILDRKEDGAMQNNLRELMQTQKLTPTKLARDIKVSRGTIYKILNGGTPAAGVMLKLQDYFGRKDIFYATNVQQIEQR